MPKVWLLKASCKLLLISHNELYIEAISFINFLYASFILNRQFDTTFAVSLNLIPISLLDKSLHNSCSNDIINGVFFTLS